MDKKAKLLTVMLSLILLVSLTMACTLPGLGGAVTEETPAAPPAAEGTPAAPPPTGETPEASPPTEETPEAPPPAEETPTTPPSAELPFEMDVEALNNLSSYAYTLHFEGLSSTAAGVEHATLDIQGQRQTQPTRAEQLSFSSVTDGDSTSADFIYIEEQNKMWTRDEGGEWQEIPVMDPAMVEMFDAFSIFSWWNTLFAGDPEDAEYLGQEMANGIQTHHYRAGETASWGFAVGCTFASVQDDIWVAVDGNFPVKRQFDAAGECQGESGEVHFLMDVSNVNQPLNISPPI